MKTLFFTAMFLLLGCAGSKPQPQAKEGDAEKCKTIYEIREWSISQGFDMNQKYPFENDENCYCETIICNNVPTCYAWKCKEP